MTIEEKTIIRHLFQNKIYKSDGQAFEDIFISVMNYYDHNFQAIKPWGSIGDRKNDGYIKNRCAFFQVYSPEDVKKSYIKTLDKIKTDFNELLKEWSPINEYYFVLNDKYKGIHPDCNIMIKEIADQNSILKYGVLTAKDIENILFKLSDDEIYSIAGYLPDPVMLKSIDYSVLNEIIIHIMKIPINYEVNCKIVLPDWDDKIKFNDLSNTISRYLDSGFYQIKSLEEYLSNNGAFLAENLKETISDVYKGLNQFYHGDELFWKLVDKLSPRVESAYQSTVIIIMSKYFESCDIFEEPEGEI